MENIENRIKIESRNQLYKEDTFRIDKTKLERLILDTETQLNETIQNLNEKEKIVYEVQKEKFKNFSNEIQIFESIKRDLEERLEKSIKINEEKLIIKKKRDIEIGMIISDYESHQIMLNIKEKEKEELKKRIGALERTYPKEFEYLYQDLVLKKELMQVINERKEIKRKLKYKESDLNKLKIEILDLEVNIEKKKGDLIKTNFEIDEGQQDIYYREMEEYIAKNVSSVMNFDKFKSLINGKYLIIRILLSKAIRFRY